MSNPDKAPATSPMRDNFGKPHPRGVRYSGSTHTVTIGDEVAYLGGRPELREREWKVVGFTPDGRAQIEEIGNPGANHVVPNPALSLRAKAVAP